MTENLLFGGKGGGESNGSASAKRLTIKVKLLKNLHREGCKSIPELCKISGMSSPTIKKILDDLINEGLVFETGLGSSGGGRRPELYGLNPESRYVLGLDISRFETRMGLFNLSNHSVSPIKCIPGGLETHEDVLALIRENFKLMIDEAGISSNRFIGAGVAFPGLIDYRSGMSYSYFSESGKPATELFREVLGMPAFIENDTRAMALGEAAFGLAKGKQNVLCLNIGIGIGLSMLLNGRLYAGNSGFAGEFGHITIDPQGQLCYCGKIGCLETIASGRTLLSKVKTEIENGAFSFINELEGFDSSKINIGTLINAAEMGDQFAIGLIAECGQHLGRGIATLIHLFNPELIIIGGEMARAGNLLTDPIQQMLNLHTISRIRKDAVIATSNLGENAGIMGTVALVMEKVFTLS